MAETLLNQQEPRVEQGTDTRQQNNNLKRIIGIILSLVMIALTVYVLNLQSQNSAILSRSTDMAMTASSHATANYLTYVGKYKETKIELDETTKKLEAVNRQLDEVTAELTTTKSMLTETQGMLTDAQVENAKLKQELQGLDALRGTENVQNMAQLQNKIQDLKDKDAQVTLQLTDLKTQLRAFQGDFSNLSEGQSLITLFQSKIRLVKSHMHYLKQQAFFARVAAQKEKDRLAVLSGNDGYVLHNGKLQSPNGNGQSFAIEVKNVQ